MKKVKIESSSFVNLTKAAKTLKTSLATPVTEPRDLSGIIKDFEMVYELSWKVLKKKLLNDGIQTTGPRDVFQKSFQANYIDREDLWLQMINDRNHAAHVYSEIEAQRIVERIRTDYVDLFERTFDFS